MIPDNDNYYVKVYQDELFKRTPVSYRTIKEKKPYWELSATQFEAVVTGDAQQPTKDKIARVEDLYR